MRKYLVMIAVLLCAATGSAQLFLNGNVNGTLQYVLDANGVPTALQISTSTISTVGIAGSNSDEFTVGVSNGTALLNVDGTSTGIFMCSDDAGAANCTFDTTGAGNITIGSADVLTVTITTDGTGDGSDLVLPTGAVQTAEILDDTITFGDFSDSSAVDADTTFTMADGIEMTLTPSYTSGDSEALTVDFNKVDDGAATDDSVLVQLSAVSESGDAGDTLYGMKINYEEGTANDIMDAAIWIDNAETTVSTMSDAIIILSSGVNAGITDAIDVSASNIVNSINVGANPVVTGNVAGTIGDATTDSWTLTTDGTGNAEVVLPENSIGPDEVAAFTDTVIFCGENAENGTIYFAPALAPLLGDGSTSYAVGAAGCDALDNADEGTADLPLTDMPALKVTGMICRSDATMGAGETQVFTLRSAVGDIVPSVTCTIGEAATSCSTVVSSTTDIAAGATVAVSVVAVDNNGDGDESWCKVGIAYK